jgi:hypothetical protein
VNCRVYVDATSVTGLSLLALVGINSSYGLVGSGCDNLGNTPGGGVPAGANGHCSTVILNGVNGWLSSPLAIECTRV